MDLNWVNPNLQIGSTFGLTLFMRDALLGVSLGKQFGSQTQAPYCGAWSESQTICYLSNNSSKCYMIFAKFWIIFAADENFQNEENIT